VLAVLSTITVVHRIQYTYWNTKHLAPISELPKIAAAAVPVSTPAAVPSPAPAREVALGRENPELQS
jgi:CDP-diacylglycerol---glycerol-3-phosphate 3-phosphatidyltransferase